MLRNGLHKLSYDARTTIAYLQSSQPTVATRATRGKARQYTLPNIGAFWGRCTVAASQDASKRGRAAREYSGKRTDTVLDEIAGTNS